MKILHATDLHYRKGWFAWLEREAPQFDATVLSGDIYDIFLTMYRGMGVPMRHQAKWLLAYLERFPAPLFLVSGNHDFEHALHWKNPLVRGDGTEEVFQGCRFVCAPWAEPPAGLKSGPEPLVLISHAPPAGVPVALRESGDVGDPELTPVVLGLPAGSLVLSGHAHNPPSWFAPLGAAMCLNPGTANHASSIPNHIIIDTERRLAGLIADDARWAVTAIHY